MVPMGRAGHDDTFEIFEDPLERFAILGCLGGHPATISPGRTSGRTR